MLNTPLSRRHLLAGASASAAAGILAQEAHGKAPMLNTQAPSFYRFKLGTMEATIVSDGPLPIGPATRTFKGPTEAELNKMFAEHFLPTDNIVLDQNILVLNTGDRLILFDTGMYSVKRPNTHTGRLPISLQQAGMWGVARVLRNERPDLRPRLVDLGAGQRPAVGQEHRVVAEPPLPLGASSTRPSHAASACHSLAPGGYRFAPSPPRPPPAADRRARRRSRTGPCAAPGVRRPGRPGACPGWPGRRRPGRRSGPRDPGRARRVRKLRCGV